MVVEVLYMGSLLHTVFVYPVAVSLLQVRIQVLIFCILAELHTLI